MSRNITTTKFFLVKVELNEFEIIGAVTIKDAEPVKKTRREIFILLKPFYYIIQRLKNLKLHCLFLVFLKRPIIL